jgi:hypothetical protein
MSNQYTQRPTICNELLRQRPSYYVLSMENACDTKSAPAFAGASWAAWPLVPSMVASPGELSMRAPQSFAVLEQGLANSHNQDDGRKTWRPQKENSLQTKFSSGYRGRMCEQDTIESFPSWSLNTPCIYHNWWQRRARRRRLACNYQTAHLLI